MSVEVRAARATDAAAIAAIALEVHRIHAEAMPGLFQPATAGVVTAGDVKRLLHAPGNLVIVATADEGTVIGYAHAEEQWVPAGAYKRESRRLHVHAMGVTAASRGGGAGHLLLAAVRAAAAARGCRDGVSLDVYAFNETARRFYEREGLVVLQQRMVTPPDDEGEQGGNIPGGRATDGHALNRSSYDAVAGEWDRARAAFQGRERAWLARFLDGLPAPASILDLGCGTGRPFAEALLGLGHRVTGVDQSERMLEHARARLPGATWVHAAIEAYEPVERHDGVLLWDSLFHVERRHHRPVLRRVCRALVPGGRVMATVGGSEQPPFTDTMFDREFFYDSLPPDAMMRMLVEVGLELVAGEFLNLPTGGRERGRYVVVARRPPAPTSRER